MSRACAVCSPGLSSEIVIFNGSGGNSLEKKAQAKVSTSNAVQLLVEFIRCFANLGPVTNWRHWSFLFVSCDLPCRSSRVLRKVSLFFENVVSTDRTDERRETNDAHDHLPDRDCRLCITHLFGSVILAEITGISATRTKHKLIQSLMY